MPSQRGVSGVSLRDFMSAVLRGLGAPVTEINLAKLGAVARTEGHGGAYNPFNYVTPTAGSTRFNSVGVQNYPNAQTGVDMTIRLLRGSRDSQKRMLASLVSGDTYASFIHATQDYYNSWGGQSGANLLGGTSSERAIEKLNEQVDGPPSGGLAGGSGPGGSAFDQAPWANAQESAFSAWLRTQAAPQQQSIIDRLRSSTDLAGVAGILNDPNTQQPVKDYIGYLAQLDKSSQGSSLGRLGVQSRDPGAPPPSNTPSPELTNLLSGLGVQYPNAPQPTPALLAFLNGLGLNLQTAADLKTRAIQRIGATMSDAMSDIDRASGRTKQNITGDLVRRGILSSGESNMRYARQAEDVGAQRRDVQRSGAQAKETTEDAYTQARDAARQQALDRVIGAEQEQTTASAAARANTDFAKQQADLAELNYARESAARQEALRQQTQAFASQGATV